MIHPESARVKVYTSRVYHARRRVSPALRRERLLWLVFSAIAAGYLAIHVAAAFIGWRAAVGAAIFAAVTIAVATDTRWRR